MLGQAQDLAERLEQTIRQSLPCEPTVRVQQYPKTGRVRISPVEVADPKSVAALPLFGNRELLAHSTFTMFAEATDDGFLKVDRLRTSLTPAFEGGSPFLDRRTEIPPRHRGLHSAPRPGVRVRQRTRMEAAVEDGREIARRFQVRTIARNFPVEVAEALKSRGWTVTPPDDFDGWESTDTLREL